MNILDRVNWIQAVLEAAGGHVLGYKKMAKIVYLIQEMGYDLGYDDYKLDMHGVFSHCLYADIRIAESFGSVEVHGEPVQIAASEVMPKSDKSFPIEGEVLIRLLNSKPTRVLEVFSTLVYLRNNGYEEDVLQENLIRLCGHLSDYFEDANKLYTIYKEIKCTC